MAATLGMDLVGDAGLVRIREGGGRRTIRPMQGVPHRPDQEGAPPEWFTPCVAAAVPRRRDPRRPTAALLVSAVWPSLQLPYEPRFNSGRCISLPGSRFITDRNEYETLPGQ